MAGRVDFNEAWLDVKSVIDARYEHFPRHQGTTDVTEVVEFASLANEHDLSDKEYDRLIDRGEQYLKDLYGGMTPEQLEKKYRLVSSAQWTERQKKKAEPHKKARASPTSSVRRLT